MKTEALLPALDVGLIRNEFPILDQRIHGRDLVYFDNAACVCFPRKA